MQSLIESTSVTQIGRTLNATVRALRAMDHANDPCSADAHGEVLALESAMIAATAETIRDVAHQITMLVPLAQDAVDAAAEGDMTAADRTLRFMMRVTRSIFDVLARDAAAAAELTYADYYIPIAEDLDSCP